VRTSVQYRVDVRSGDHVETLGYLRDCHPHHTALDPYVSWLALHGRTGLLSLIDERTGEEVARRWPVLREDAPPSLLPGAPFLDADRALADDVGPLA
jgi:hypothetical protein